MFLGLSVTIVVLFCIFLFLIAPKKDRGVNKFTRVKYAHRGLHNEKRAENSMSAFLTAANVGYAIELDVRLSKDGRLVVFHDSTLDRVCGVEGKVSDFTASELSKFSLNGTGEGVPLFTDVLAAINGKVPLLVEIKEDGMSTDTAAAVCEVMKNYKGLYLIESFSPFALRVVKKRLPNAYRGILSFRYLGERKFRKPHFLVLQLLMANFYCRPHFIAYDHNHPRCISLKLIRAFFKVPILAWTVRSREEEVVAYNNGFDAVIFENYCPKP